MRKLSIALIPAMTLLAQAPANTDLAQRFNTELPGINQLLKEFKSKEALLKVEALIPPQTPAFIGPNAKDSNLRDIAQGLGNAQGLMSFYRLHAKVAVSCGLWEKALEIQQQRSQSARAMLADLEKAQAPIATMWKKVEQEAGDYLAKNEPRKKELEPKLKAFKTEFDTVSAEVKSGKRKLSKKEADDINARGAQAQIEEQELAQITAALPVHRQNQQNAPKAMKVLDDNRKEIEGLIKAADDAVADAKKAVVSQNDEITQFNTDQVLKKVKVVGKKNWVDAVMRKPENITKLGSPQDQASFLNRLLVLDPGNASVQKALDNLIAGKEVFPAAPKSAGKKKK